MEGGDHQANGGSRWNPTKEQISMLEGFYKQGLRTPSAEQIQQITNRLRAFGHIEGKNVFYWFQNHKARQRQKQKQESLAYLNRALFPHPNVVCSPYYGIAARTNEQMVYQQLKRSRIMPERCQRAAHHHNKRTLDLFPIHPTGILQSRSGIEKGSESSSSSRENSSFGNEGDDDHQPLFNFFYGGA